MNARSELPIALLETLAQVTDVMAAAKRNWWVIGSAAAALHNARPIQVADVDILFDIEDGPTVFQAAGISGAPGTTHPLFRSDLFATWTRPPLPVDFMAGFHLRDGCDWRRLLPKTREPVLVATCLVYLPERAELRRMFEDFGRPKDLGRARLLGNSNPLFRPEAL